MADSTEFRRPSVTVDVVLLHTPTSGPPAVFLRQRENPPCAGSWALPGSFVQMEEDLEATARRALLERVGLQGAPALEQLGTFGALARDPRTRVITTAYLGLLPDRPETQVGAWFTLHMGSEGLTLKGEDGTQPELAFDHLQIVARAQGRLRHRGVDPLLGGLRRSGRPRSAARSALPEGG